MRSYQLVWKEILLCGLALEDLAKNHSDYPVPVVEIMHTLDAGKELTRNQREQLVLALHCYSVKKGWKALEVALKVSRETATEAQLRNSLKHWIVLLKNEHEQKAQTQLSQ